MERIFTRFMVFILFANTGVCQSFYDQSVIQKIEIQFAQSNWDYALDTAASGAEDYVMAQWVKINGQQFDSVGVRYKGNSSYNPNQVKNPLHIELDTYKSQDYQGYKDLKLSNGFKDPSFVREVLSYKILRQYMVAPESNYAQVYINGQEIGLYCNTESITKSFVADRFYSNQGSFFKCNPVSSAGGNACNLLYLGADSSLYFNRYEMKSDFGWNDLVESCNSVTSNTNIETSVDVDRALWMLAFDNAFVNLDSYIGGITQNYYLYRDGTNRFNPIIWDLNENFGVFSNTGTSNLNSTTQKQQMSHLLHATDNNWPLVKSLLANTTFKRMYIAHMRTLLFENITNNLYTTWGQELQTIVDTAVAGDPNKL